MGATDFITPDSLATLVLCFATLLLGATTQRVAGMGVGLVADPVLAILFGPVDGILLVNMLAVINAAINAIVMRQNVDWHRVALIGSTLVLGAVPAVFMIRTFPSALLQVVVGGFALVGLGVILVGGKRLPVVTGRLGALIAGALGGFMNTVAGIAAPAFTAYAQAAHWNHRSYRATFQVLFVLAGLLSIVVKLGAGVASMHTRVEIWPVALAGLAAGIILGALLDRVVPPRVAHRTAIVLAMLSALAALVKGLSALV